MLKPKRPRGRPRKNGQQALEGAAEAQERRQRRPVPGSNVTDATRLEYLERGRLAYLEAMRVKEHYQSAWRVYSQLVKDAKKVGASEIAWTLEAMRRDPLEVEREISERVRMAQLVNLPLGFQLNMFEAPAENPPQAAAAPAPPEPKPDIELPPDEEMPDEQEEPQEDEEEEASPEKAGNEILEQSDDDANAFLQGQRAFILQRTFDSNPYNKFHSTHNAWARGWKAKEMAKAAAAQ